MNGMLYKTVCCFYKELDKRCKIDMSWCMHTIDKSKDDKKNTQDIIKITQSKLTPSSKSAVERGTNILFLLAGNFRSSGDSLEKRNAASHRSV